MNWIREASLITMWKRRISLVQADALRSWWELPSEDIRLKAAIEVTSTAIVKKHFYRNSTFGEIYYSMNRLERLPVR